MNAGISAQSQPLKATDLRQNRTLKSMHLDEAGVRKTAEFIACRGFQGLLIRLFSDQRLLPPILAAVPSERSSA